MQDPAITCAMRYGYETAKKEYGVNLNRAENESEEERMIIREKTLASLDEAVKDTPLCEYEKGRIVGRVEGLLLAEDEKQDAENDRG